MVKPPTREEVFKLVTKLLSGMDFSIAEQAKILGCTRPVVEHIDDLYAEVLHLGYDKVASRYQTVCGISIQLGQIFGNDGDAMRRWLRVKHRSGTQSVHELMASGSPADMGVAIQILNEAVNSSTT